MPSSIQPATAGDVPNPPPEPTPNPKFAVLPGEAALDRAVAGLRARGFTTHVVDSAEAARAKLAELLPPSGSVLEATSQTLVAAGVNSAWLAGRGLDPIRPRLVELQKAGRATEAKQIAGAPDVVVGSVHAITEAGEVLVASASGSQLGPYAYGASRVFWLVGAQKLVPDLLEAERRIDEYSFPLENRRAHQAYGQGSVVAKILLFRREPVAGRSTVIVIRDRLGF